MKAKKRFIVCVHLFPQLIFNSEAKARKFCRSNGIVITHTEKYNNETHAVYFLNGQQYI